MKAPVSIAVAAIFAIAAAPVSAGGGPVRPMTHREAAASVPRHGQVIPPRHGEAIPPRHGQAPVQGIAPAATNPGMPSFYQPSYSIDRKEWWQPHPYFPQSAQSPGYPSRPPVRPYAGYWNEQR